MSWLPFDPGFLLATALSEVTEKDVGMEDQVQIRFTVTIDMAEIERLLDVAPTSSPVEMQPPLNPPRSLLDVEQVADLLGVSKGMVYELRRSGEGPPGIRIGNRLRWRPEDVEEWLISNTA